MTAALNKGENEANEAVADPKVKGECKKVRDEEETVSSAETGQEMVEDTGHGPEKCKIMDLKREKFCQNLLERMRRLRVFPTSPSVDTREDNIPIITHLE